MFNLSIFKSYDIRGIYPLELNEEAAYAIGRVPIDAVYFAVRKQEYQAGVMITASHNPKDYNGFKLPLSDIGWVRGEELRDDVVNLPPLAEKIKGDIKEFDILPDYI